MIDDNMFLKADLILFEENFAKSYQVALNVYRSAGELMLKADEDDCDIGFFDSAKCLVIIDEYPLSQKNNEFENQRLADVIGIVDLNEIIAAIEEEYNLDEKDKNECGFYHISDIIEVIPNLKDEFTSEEIDGYQVEELKRILEFKKKRNAPKDQPYIEKITKYLEENKK